MHTTLNQIPTPRDTESRHGQSLKIQVVATSVEGTRAALGAVQSLAAGLVARVVVFVPHIVPYGEALDHPTVKPDAIGARYGRLAEELSFEVEVRVCVCRSWAVALGSVLSREAPVVLGGHARRWLRTREQRLAATLSRGGYEVLFIAPESRYTRAWRGRSRARAGSLRTTR